MTQIDEHDFLDRLYSAAIQPDLWEDIIEIFADMVGGSSVWLSRLSIVDGTGSGLSARIDPAMPALYLGHFAAVNPLNNVADPLRYIADWRPKILTDDDWMPKADLLRTEYYNDFLRPQDIHATMMIRLGIEGTETSVLNVNRAEREGRFTAEELERSRRLHPHLIRAFTLSQKVMAREPHASGLGAVFDNSAAGLFLLDRDARVLRRNGAGEALVSASKGLRIQGGALHAGNVVATRHLHALIRQAASEDPECRAGGWLSLTRDGGGPPLSISVIPVRVPAMAVFNHEPCVLLCANDVESAPALPERKLRELFSLSAAEARVARAILEGDNPREAAVRLGVSVNTVNNQLASIFSKTGVNRQSALVRMMTRLTELNIN